MGTCPKSQSYRAVVSVWLLEQGSNPQREGCRELGSLCVPKGLTPLGPALESPWEAWASMDGTSVLLYEMRGEGLDQGRDCSGTSSSLSLLP